MNLDNIGRSVLSALGVALCIAALGSAEARADVFKKPSDVKELGTTTIAPGGQEDLVEITPAASNAGLFTVPAKRVFVITTVGIFPEAPGAGELRIQLVQGSAVREFWRVSNAAPTQLQFPTGMVVQSGTSMSMINQGGSAGSVRIGITGYLAKDK